MKRYSLLLIPLITIIFSSCINLKTENSIKGLRDKYPNIISVAEHRDAKGNRFLDIKMENEKRLFIIYFRSIRSEAPFHIFLIEKSTFEIAHFSGGGRIKKSYPWIGIPIDFIAKNIVIQLNSVDDVIENYDLIYNFTNSLTRLADIVDIDLKNEIIYGLENTIFLGRYRWISCVQPIIADEDEWYILNVTYDEVPNARRFQWIAGIKGERKYFH